MLRGLIASPQPVARMHQYLEQMHQKQSRRQRDLDTHWLSSRQVQKAKCAQAFDQPTNRSE